MCGHPLLALASWAFVAVVAEVNARDGVFRCVQGVLILSISFMNGETRAMRRGVIRGGLVAKELGIYGAVTVVVRCGRVERVRDPTVREVSFRKTGNLDRETIALPLLRQRR